MRSASAFAPAHVTGFFAEGGAENGDERGSVGAGVCLSLGTTSHVTLKPGTGVVLWADREGEGEGRQVSQTVAQAFMPFLKGRWDVRIEQDQPYPSGYGLGSSGAAALSLALAFDAALGFPLGPAEAARVAHRADLACRTGLGTVLAMTARGVEIRTRSGAPGRGQVVSLEGTQALWVHVGLYAPLDTRRMLSRDDLLLRLGEAGRHALGELLARPGWGRFLELSAGVTDLSGLLEGPALEAARALRGAGRLACMPLFGQGVFWLTEGPDPQGRQLIEIFRPSFAWSGPVSREGARVVTVHIDSP